MAGEGHAENGTQVKDDNKKTKHNNFEKAKHAAVSTLAAAAVKAKLLANEEEDQIRQLASLLVEKQVMSWPGMVLIAFYLHFLFL